MKRYCFFLPILLTALSCSAALDWIAKNSVGNANSRGYAHIEKQLPKIDFGTDTVRFFMDFISDPYRDSGFFGLYWNVSLFNTSCVKVRENQYEWRAPNGTHYFLTKNSSADPKNTDAYLYNHGEWILKETSAKNIRIEDGKNNDVFFTYKNGRLAKFCAKPKGDVFAINYAVNGRIDSIVNESKKNVVLKISYAGEDLVKSLTVGNETCAFEYEDFKLPSFPNKKLLSKIIYPDGTADILKYSLPQPRSRRIVDKKFNERGTPLVSVMRMDQTSASGSKGWIEWCAESGMIMSDGGGEYKIGNDKNDVYYSEKAREYANKGSTQPTPSFVSFIYERKDKKYPERYFYDWDNLIRITSNSDTGVSKRESLIGAVGPIYLEPRKIEEMKDGDISNPSWDFVKSFVYDDKGRLIRELDKFGNVKSWEYFKDSSDVATIINNGELIYSKIVKPNGDVEEFEKGHDRITRTFYNPRNSEVIEIVERKTGKTWYFQENGEVKYTKYETKDG